MKTRRSCGSLRLHAMVVAAVTIVGVTASVASCEPPHQRDSDRKIATALGRPLEQTGHLATRTDEALNYPEPTSAQPGFIDCLGPAVIRPAFIHISCIDGNDIVAHLYWRSWTEEQATAVGLRVTRDPVNESSSRSASQTSAQAAAKTTTSKTTTSYKPVTVELRDPTATPSGVVFKTITVDEQPVTGVAR